MVIGIRVSTPKPRVLDESSGLILCTWQGPQIDWVELVGGPPDHHEGYREVAPYVQQRRGRDTAGRSAE